MKKSIILFMLASCLSCTQNLLEGTSASNVDDDYYTQAMDALNDQDFDLSIDIVTNRMSASSQTEVRARELLASAYAGKCGLNFLDYTDKLSQASAGSALSIMMSPFVQATVADPAYCKLALQTMELIGPTEARTANQNIFSSITGMVLLGTALRTSADLSPSLGDGAADVDLCTGVTDAQVDDMILGFGHFYKNFSAVSEDLIGSGSNSSFDEIVTACNTVPGATCDITDPSQITPSIRDFYRDVANTQNYGLGNFDTGGDPMQIPNACP